MITPAQMSTLQRDPKRKYTDIPQFITSPYLSLGKKQALHRINGKTNMTRYETSVGKTLSKQFMSETKRPKTEQRYFLKVLFF